jgi:hypothetical protein
MGADAEVYRPICGSTRAPKAVFVGQNYADRSHWLATLLENGIPVDIFGFGRGKQSTANDSCNGERNDEGAIYPPKPPLRGTSYTPACLCPRRRRRPSTVPPAL